MEMDKLVIKKYFFASALVVLLLTGCASKPDKTDFNEESSGFLLNYDSLKPIESPEDFQVYTYVNSKVNKKDYFAAIVEPVFIYDGAIEDDNLTREQIEDARRGLTQGLRTIIKNKYELTDARGPGVFRVRTAITGALLEKEGLKPWNIIPVSAAITLAAHASGNESKKPVLIVELLITDSISDELIAEILTISSGENFRRLSNTSDEFEDLAQKWVEKAMQYTKR